MIKRTILLTTVFATLLSAAFSVQADDLNYYWAGSNTSMFTTSNWKVGSPDGDIATVALTQSGYNFTLYVDSSNGKTLEFDNSNFASIRTMNIGTVAGDTTAAVQRTGGLTFIIADGKTLNVYAGGSFTYKHTQEFQTNGTINVSGGAFTIQTATNFRLGNANSTTLTISSGELTVNCPAYIGVSANTGTINQTGGNATFTSDLDFGWGDGAVGKYNLSGGTLTTTGSAGLWTGNPNGISTFTVTGGTANFNKTGESFTVGLGGTNQLANVFTLSSGTVNAADTFAIKYGGTLNVAKNGETGGDGVLNAKAITLTNNGNLNMSSGTINVGEGGITSSDGAYSITLSGGTFGTNGASWSSALNAAISANTVTFAPETGKTITWSGNFTKENNSDRGTIRKTGAGTLAFNSTSDTSANTINANLTIDEGTVILNQSPGGGNRFASGVVVTVNSGGKLQCNIADSLGWGANSVTFNLYGGEFAMNVASNDTLTNKTFNLKGGAITTLNSVDSKFDIYGSGNAFNVEAETGATAQNPTTSYVKGWLRLRNTTDFNITVNENAKLVVDKNFGIYDNYESTKPLVKLGPGVLVFEGNNSYTQGTKISAGTLILTENGSLGTGAVVNEASLIFAHDSEQTFTNAVSGTGTVTKTGEGRLKINAANGFQASSLIVEAGRLDFKGTLTGGGITLSENTVFSPGNSVGMAAVGGDFTLSSNSSILMEIGGSDTAQNDGLDVSGELKLNEGLIYLQMADTFNLTSGTRFYALLNGSNSGVLSDEDFIEKYVRAYGGFTELEYVQMTEGDYAGKYAITGVFDANAIPEPSTWLLLVLGTAGLFYWRKKK